MNNRCPNCGHVITDSDIYCSICGTKIKQTNNESKEDVSQNGSTSNNKEDEKIYENNTENNLAVQQIIENSFSDFLAKNIKNKSRQEFSSSIYSNTNTSTSSPSTSLIVAVLLIFTIVICVSNLVVQQQTNAKERLVYKNFINNPDTIPELKEPMNYQELNSNFIAVNNFLELYLKRSKDENEKKEKIFINYLTEIEKISHISADNIASDIKECNNINSSTKAIKCSAILNKKIKDSGIKSYANRENVYFYPDNKYIQKRYSKYFTKEMQDYLDINKKYNIPATSGHYILIKPKKLANKIADFELFIKKAQNSDINDRVQKVVYNDTKAFIFSTDIYGTTTHEMKKEYRNAYKYYINKYRNSSLKPLFMSYLNKQTSYSEDNFKNDYPYKMYNNNGVELENSTFRAIFTMIKNTQVNNNTSSNYKYIYDAINETFIDYESSIVLKDTEYIFTGIDEDNNIDVLTNNMTMFQSINLPKNSKLFLINSKLYAYNSDKLCIYKIYFNGKIFNTNIIQTQQVNTIFPGIRIIDIDSFDNYNIYLEKENKNASFIILSSHSQGWDNYTLSAIQGEFQTMTLDNMFKLNTNEDVLISFHSKNVNANETSDNAPSYKITIHTMGQPQTIQDNMITNYDEKTSQEEAEKQNFVQEDTKPKMMPKIEKKENNHNEELEPPPSEVLEPPKD